MTINFTGLKNIGYINLQFDLNNGVAATDSDDDIEEAEVSHSYGQEHLTVQLTDDYNGKDLTEFKNAIVSSDLERKYPNPIGNDFLHIAVEKEDYQKGYLKNSKVSYYVNGEEVKINDKNLKFIGFVAKLLKKISQTPEDKMVYNKDFLNGEVSDKAIIIGGDIKKLFGPAASLEKHETIYNSRQAVQGAECMFNSLQDTMMNYFA